MSIPLAEKLRPLEIKDFVGQKHLIGRNKPLSKMLETGQVVSLLFWGPPGSGKTTLARLIANHVKAHFVNLSAVSAGKADVLKIVAQAKEYNQLMSRRTILFIDEIHRFNKSQQDAFLPYVEDGTIILIGATTENPSFSINAPLLSRCRVFRLYSHGDEELKTIVNKAAANFPKNKFAEDALGLIPQFVGGDARAAINAVEMAAGLSKNVTVKVMEQALQKKALYYDKKGDAHYDTISAFIKSMRGSQPDAALHYLARMIKAGEDPVFIARRMVIFASEDIGNARTNALVLAVACMQAVQMIGMPEASLILAQTVTYLATCPKSIASTEALYAALRDIDLNKLDQIPLHLRNAPNKFMESLGYGKDHVRYPWKVEKETGRKVSQQYLPDNLKDRKYYQPDWN
jgi:putative ATPase